MTQNMDDQTAEAIADFARIHGDEIMEAAGRQPMANGSWSEEDIDWLWEECKKRVTGSPPTNS